MVKKKSMPAAEQATRGKGDKQEWRWLAVYGSGNRTVWAKSVAAAVTIATAKWGKPERIERAPEAPQAGERGRNKTTGFAIKTTPEELAELRRLYGAPQPPKGNFSGNILARLLPGESS